MTLTQERLKELLDYDPLTGIFRWRKELRRRLPLLGHVAGSPHPGGYLRIKLDRKSYYAHRLAWLYVIGSWPNEHIDHVDGDRSNNSICNLRSANSSQNMANTKHYSTNKSGFKGASWHKGRYRAGICVQGRRMELGRFHTAEEAHAAYATAAEIHFGEFARAS